MTSGILKQVHVALVGIAAHTDTQILHRVSCHMCCVCRACRAPEAQVFAEAVAILQLLVTA